MFECTMCIVYVIRPYVNVLGLYVLRSLHAARGPRPVESSVVPVGLVGPVVFLHTSLFNYTDDIHTDSHVCSRVCRHST